MFYFFLRFLACFCGRLLGFCGRFACFCGRFSEFPDLRAFASKTRQTPKLPEISSRWKLQDFCHSADCLDVNDAVNFPEFGGK